MLRVLVVDDHPVVRDGLRAMLDGHPGIKIVGEAGTGEEAIQKAKQLEPDVVLTDIRMPDMSGIEVTRRIKAEQPGTAVIALTMYDSEVYMIEAIRAGAVGYLVKDCSRELLCHTINAAVRGGTMVRSDLLRRANQGPSRGWRQIRDETDHVVAERFTVRELDVLRLVVQGYTNKDIARELGLVEVTVKKHLQNIVGKLGVSDRTQAAVMAMRLGLVE